MIRSVVLAALLGGMLAPVAASAPIAGDTRAGQRLYWHGVGAGRSPVHATIQGDVKVTGEQFSCVNCHRPSGFGSSEGGKYVPPISGPILFSPRQLDRNRIYTKLFEEAQPTGFAADVRMPRMRPAYTGQALAVTLRTGVDPAGRKLNPQMPRYDLSDRDAANLAAYLKTLSATPSPGVDSQVIHFATVVSDGTDPDRRAAVVETISAFFDWMNRATHGYQSRPGFSPYHMSELASAFRHWKLHVWRLHGPADSWPGQIRRQYDRQPVFAVISGLVHGPWNPIAEFCDQRRMPCVFPNTELPGTENPAHGYSIYFSRGLGLEGAALATYLNRGNPAVRRIALVRSTDPYGATPARAFRAKLESGTAAGRIQEFRFSTAAELDTIVHRLASRSGDFDALVLWPGDQLDASLAALNRWRPRVGLICLPSDALSAGRRDRLTALANDLRFTYPYELPSTYHPRAFRVRQWMHAQHLRIKFPRLQFQTYYALTMAEFALDQILDDFYRDYFVESIEHLAENNLDVGTHPTLALGPGQRFASKGAYIVRLDAAKPGHLRALSDWIVP